MAMDTTVVPVIDLANFPKELVKLASAATTSGCFRLVNHGMSPALIADIRAVARSLFQIPTEVKLRSVNEKLYKGGYFVPSECYEYFESFGIYNAASPADVHSFLSILDTSTLQREIISEFIAKLHGMITDMAYKVAESLGLNLAGCSFDDWPCQIRLNSYNFKEEEDIGKVGVPVHTDSGIFTLLLEDDCAGGLEIMDSNGNYVAVDPVPDTYLFFIGDAGKVWSNGRLNNVKHRVVCKEAVRRISIVLFLLAPKDDKVEPEAAFVDAEHPKLYRPFIYNDYRKLRDKLRLRAGELLELFKEDELGYKDLQMIAGGYLKPSK